MIQRIQTLYLLVVVILQSILFFSNQAIAAEETETIENVFRLAQNWQWAILVAITALLPLITIFLYKNRRLQIRLSLINAILLLALQAVIIYFLIKFNGEFETISYSITDISPIISLILTILAIRFIIKDEIKVRALDRIR